MARETSRIHTLSALALFALVGSAHAVIFTVNDTGDFVDETIGDGICDAAGANGCTLRAAIQEANALAGADTITLPAGTFTLTIAGAGEELGGHLRKAPPSLTHRAGGPPCCRRP